MHIYEGILAATPAGREVLLAGAAAAAVGTAVGLWRLDYDRIPRTAVLSAAFFVASVIQVPLGPTSVHLLLGGLMGLVLGWSAFPAVLIALLLQAVFFSIGGLTRWGSTRLHGLAGGDLRLPVPRGGRQRPAAGGLCGRAGGRGRPPSC